MKLELVTLTGPKLSADVYEVIIPTLTGYISVLPGHEPLVTLLGPGALGVRHSKSDPSEAIELFAVLSGVVEITGRSVTVMSDEAESGRDITEVEAKAAYERALKLRESAKTQLELDEAHKLLDRHAVRLKVADLQRRHRDKHHMS